MQSVNSFLAEQFDCSTPKLVETVQRLWSGYGAIERWLLGQRTVIVKRVSPPTAVDHPRGWHSDLSHRRKVRSYQVESNFYARINSVPCPARTAQLYGHQSRGEQHLLVLEDLQQAGFDCAVTMPSEIQLRGAIGWLAQLHGHFLGHDVDGLWPQGCYWHLDTRPEEWAQMTDLALQAAAARIDAQLKQARYQTIVHGDAKLANFGFLADQAVAFDFQYVGRGIGVVDLAYLLGSCLEEHQLFHQSERYIDYYFLELNKVLGQRGIDGAEVEAEWRLLYDVAVADFARFLNGWAPQHWKVNQAMLAATARVLAR